MEAKSKSLHVAVLAFPFGSHAGPLLNFVLRIASETPKDITFSFFCTANSNTSNFCKEKQLPPNVKPYNIHDGLPESYVPSGHPLEAVHLFLKPMPGNYGQAMDSAVAQTGNKITCIITDAFLWFAADLAHNMNATWIPLWMAGPHSLLTHVLTDHLRQKLGSNDAVGGDQSVSFLASDFSAVRVSDLPKGIVTDIEEPVAIMLHKMGQMLPRATMVAINSYDGVFPACVNELKSKFKTLLDVGPLTLTTSQSTDDIPDQHGCLEWLDKQKKASVVYIGFGTVITPPPNDLAALTEALEEGGFPFIWSFRGNPEKQFPKGFLERTKTQGKVVPWAPQVRILKHSSIGVFVSHGGWNSVMESIVGGVPMVCRPFFAEQRLNARMLEQGWGIAVAVLNDSMSKDETVNIFKSILSSEKGDKMRENMVLLSKSALKAAEPCGTSTQNFKTLIELVST